MTIEGMRSHSLGENIPEPCRCWGRGVVVLRYQVSWKVWLQVVRA